jgi:N-acetylglucosaminyldiphosphoundecaprenol N-acetyl-beta-D-mannosaminyltransferase
MMDERNTLPLREGVGDGSGTAPSPQPPPSRGGGVFRLLGLDFADLGAEAAAASIAARPAAAAFGYVVTPNADHFVRLARDPSLLPLYENAAIRLLDSRVVAGVARAFGLRPPHVATGSDVTAALLRPGQKITIIGLDPAFLPALVTRCGLAPPAHHNPPMGFEHDPIAFKAAVDFAIAHPARFILLAVGSPRQERLALAIAATGRATGTGLCIGAALEFLAGARRRAPTWMQRAGLEWLARLIADPLRLSRRYLWACPAVLRLLWRERKTTSSPRVPSAGVRLPPAGPRPHPQAFGPQSVPPWETG